MLARNAVEVCAGGTPIDPINLNEEIDDEDETEQQNNELNVYDTTTIEGLTQFIADIKCIGVGEGDKLFTTVDKRLPMVNSKLSRTKCIKKILSEVAGSLEKPINPKVRIAQLSKENTDELKRAINKHCLNADKLQALKVQILQPYEEALLLLTPDTEFAATNNSEVNRIALLAWLLLYPPATALWEKLNSSIDEEHRPAFLEQPGGPTAYKNFIYEELIKVSDVLRCDEEAMDSDRAIFNEETIGKDAAAACENIKPRAGVFKDSSSLKALHTSLINSYTIFKGRVFSSGFSKDETNIETYQRAYIYCGQGGKTKDIGLFYAFVVFSRCSTTDVTWIVRDLAGTVGRSSSSIEVKKEKPILSKKENEKLNAIAYKFFSSPGPNSVQQQPTNSANVIDLTAEDKKQIKSAQIELAELRCDEVQMGLLTKIVDCKSFSNFSEENQKEIENDIMEIARNAKRRRLGKVL